MSASPIDITGKQFGYLTAIKMVETRTKNGRVMWECVCECGNHTIIAGTSLRRGETRSCGCHSHDCSNRSKKAKNNRRLHIIYDGIKKRCYNPNCSSYKDYGGRGITLCDEWKTFDPFCDWALANGYEPNADPRSCTIDRIDNSKGYSPENCRWVTQIEQSNNKRNNTFLTFNGKTQTIAEWTRECGFSRNLISQRLKGGWSVEKTLSTPWTARKSPRAKNELGR